MSTNLLAPLFTRCVVHGEAFDHEAPSTAMRTFAAAAPLPENIRKAAPKRRGEYLAGRYCAARALELLGHPVCTIATNLDRSPRWPPGLVGTITHTEGFAAAAVAWVRDVIGVGLDSERIMTPSVCSEIEELTSKPEERALAATLGLEPLLFMTLLFSAKESLYKCLNPIVGVFFDFHAANLTGVDLDRGLYTISLTRDLDAAWLSGATFTGRFLATATHVHSALELLRDS